MDQGTYTVSDLADRLAIRLSLRRQCIKAYDRRAQGHRTGQGQSTKDTDLLGLRPVLSKCTSIKGRAERVSEDRILPTGLLDHCLAVVKVWFDFWLA